MRRVPVVFPLVACSLLALLGVTVPTVSAQDSDSAYRPQRNESAVMDVGLFYDDLSPYGEWVELADYGWTFAPRVDRDWRPYTRGQWIWTDDGWYWESDEDFGWAAYHYGRWVNDRDYGWVWVPGTEWAPAWVSWRHGNGYTGWAPLPPRVTWRMSFGLSIGGVQLDAYLGARDYNFVPDRSFVDRGLYQRVLPTSQNLTIINVTNNVTNYTYVNDRIVNGGVPIASVEQVLGRPVPHVRTVDADRANAPRRVVAGEVSVYRPSMRSAPDRRPAQGRSLIKGEAPPQLLIERRQQRDQERQQSNGQPDARANDAAQRRPAAQGQGQRAAPLPVTAPTTRPERAAPPQPTPRPERAAPPQPTPRPERVAPQQPTPQPREQANQNVDRQRVRDQNQQRAERDKQQAAEQRQREQQQRDQAKQAEPQRGRPQAEPTRSRPAPPQADKPAPDPPPSAKSKPNDRGNRKDPKPTPTRTPEKPQE